MLLHLSWPGACQAPGHPAFCPRPATLQVKLGFGESQAQLSQPMGQCFVLPPPAQVGPSAPWSSGVDKYCKSFLAGGEKQHLSFCQLFVSENTAACPASCSWLVVRGGHLHAPTTVTACHCAFEVAPDFPVCLKSHAVYAAAGPASPPAGPFHDGASRQGLEETATGSLGGLARGS